jgi:hypothetical protein
MIESEGFNNVKLPYGMRDGRLIHISDESVPSGQNCGCVCPECGEPLIAKKGEVNQYYFSHRGYYEGAGICSGGFETAAHLRAKAIIEEEGKVNFPATVGMVRDRREIWMAGGMVEVSEIIRERNLSPELRPDLYASYADGKVVIEIFVTHECTPLKKRWLRENKIPSFEIKLSAYKRSDLGADFRDAVLSRASRFWIYDPQQEAANAWLEGVMAEEWKQISRRFPKSTNPAAIECEARRCYICQGSNAFFGFGPPFTDVQVWACSDHRGQVDEMLTTRRQEPRQSIEGGLL